MTRPVNTILSMDSPHPPSVQVNFARLKRLVSGSTVVVLVASPWLNPLASGPAPSVLPWLMAAACGVLLWVHHTALTARRIAHAWAWAAALSAVIGLLQYFGYTQPLGSWFHTTPLGEAFANLRQRNQFATLTSIGLAAWLWLDMAGTRRPSPHASTRKWRLIVSLLVLVLLACGNAASSSRTGTLQWCLLLAMAAAWSAPGRRRALTLAAVALTLYCIASLALPSVLELTSGVPRGGLLARFSEDAGCGSRSVLWANVVQLILEKPWMGWGWGELDFAHFMTLYPGDRFCDILDNAHNLPLHVAVELGLPAALVALGLLVGWVVYQRPWAERNPTRQLAWSVLAVIGLHSLLEYPLWYGPFQLAVGLCALLLWRNRTGVTSTPVARQARLAPRWDALRWGIAGMLLAVLAAAAWDYWRVGQLYRLPADRNAAYRDHTLEKVRGSWFFQNQVQFAELTTRVLDHDNAATHAAQAQQLLHFSPEPRVIEAAIDSALLLGNNTEAEFLRERYKAAFPDAYAIWAVNLAGNKVS